MPLSPSTRAFMEDRFAHDFGNVRVHTGHAAAQAAAALHARAFTVGRDIVFAANEFAPDLNRGRHLIAHELAHVVQQSSLAGTAVVRRQPTQATPQNLSPIHTDEANKTLVTFNVGRFLLFIPENVILSTRGNEDTPDLKVHVFFSAGAVQGNTGNDVLTHGLRGASAQSTWVTIGVPSHDTISDSEIRGCLTSVGIKGPITALRLTGHSRGASSLLNTILNNKITTLNLIDRITLLDADEGIGTPEAKSKSLVNKGVNPSVIVAYEVNVRRRHTDGVTYRDLPSGCMAAIGYVRLVRDAMVTQSGIAQLVNANSGIQGQLQSLPLPPRGSFTTKGTPGLTPLRKFCDDNRGAVRAILNNQQDAKSGLLAFINKNNLVRFAPYVFDQGISAHHFFAAEVAHELTD